MASPNTLDDMWRDGLSALAPEQAFQRDARDRVQHRVTRRRQSRLAFTTGVVVLAIACAALVGAIANRSTPTTPASPVPLRHDVAGVAAIVGANDDLTIYPCCVTPGPVEVRLMTASGAVPSNASLRIHAASTTPTHCVYGNCAVSFVARHYGLIAFDLVQHNRVVRTAALRVVRPYRPPVGTTDSVVDITIPAGQLVLTPREVHATAGIVELRVHNRFAGQHHIEIETESDIAGGFAIDLPHGGVGTGRIRLRPGRYTIYCTIPGHRAAGMHATLVVTPRK
jgi:plastocyanin